MPYAAELYEKGAELQVHRSPTTILLHLVLSGDVLTPCQTLQTILDSHEERRLDAEAGAEDDPDTEQFKAEQELVGCSPRNAID